MGKLIFKDQVAIVTGASSGIGKATALALASRGANLVLASRNTEALNSLAGEIEKQGSKAMAATVDVTRVEDVQSMVRGTLERWGCIDILVSNAGKYVRAPITRLSLTELEESMAVNFYGGVYCVQAVLPQMLARKQGHIVLVSSMDGKIALPNDGPYVAAKFALNGFAAVLRQELAGSGISVSLVLPGRVDTPMISDLKVPSISAKIPPEAIAEGIVKAIRWRKAEVILPFQAILMYYISVLSPGLSDRIARMFHLQGWSV